MPVIATRGGASLKSFGFAGVGKPTAPTIGTATRQTNGTITVSFTAPSYNGGLPITSYTATSNPGGYQATINQSGSGSINVPGLTQGTSYTFTVRATNPIGDSPESASSNSQTAATLPGAPSVGTVTILSSSGVSVPFTAPGANGGDPITSYTAVSSPGGITGSVNQSGSGTITVSGLNPGTSYTFTVYATNGLGNGNSSASSNSVIPDYPTYSVSTNLFVVGPGNELASEGDLINIHVDTNATVPSDTIYWRITGAVNTSDFVGLSSLTGSLSITPTVRSTVSFSARADLSTEGRETFTITFYKDSGYSVLLDGTNVSGYVYGNPRSIDILDTSTTQYPPAGTYLGNFCSGFNLYYQYADGSGGSYNSLQEINSAQCGYVTPTLSASVSVNYNYTISGPNTQTKAYYVQIFWDSSAGGTQFWSINTGGLSTQTFGGTNGATSGTFGGGITNAIVGFNGQHSSTTVSITVSRSGYNSFTGNYSIPSNSVYTPYTASNGYTQESGIPSNIAASVIAWYAGNGTFFVTQDPGVPRYQLYRAPEFGGLGFWCNSLINNGWTTSSQAFLDAFGSAPETFTGPKTFYNPGTGWNQLSDRP
jgi:hypothetical protein